MKSNQTPAIPALFSLLIFEFIFFNSSGETYSPKKHISVYFKNGFAHFNAHWDKKEISNGGPGYNVLSWEYNGITHTGEPTIEIPLTELPESICIKLKCNCGKEEEDCLEIPNCSTMLEPVSLRASDATCYESNDGQIKIEAPDLSSLTFRWSTGGYTSSINHLAPGEYEVKVTNEMGCEKILKADIHEPLPLDPDLFKVSTTEVACFGGSDGTANIVVLDNHQQYTFNWPGTSFRDYTKKLSAGKHYVVVMSEEGRCVRIPFEITQPEKTSLTTRVTSNYNGFPVTCFDAANGKVEISLNGGLPLYTIEMEGSIFTGVFPNNPIPLENLTAGIHQVNVMDSKGCISKHEFNLMGPEPVSLRLKGVDICCHGDSSGNLIAMVSGGTGSYTYSWLNSKGLEIGRTASIDSLKAGMYKVEVRDQNGCTVPIGSRILTEPDKPLSFRFKSILKNSFFFFGFVSVEGGIPEYMVNGKLRNRILVFSFRPYKYIKEVISDNSGCVREKSINILKPVGNSQLHEKKQKPILQKCKYAFLKFKALPCPE